MAIQKINIDYNNDPITDLCIISCKFNNIIFKSISYDYKLAKKNLKRKITKYISENRLDVVPEFADGDVYFSYCDCSDASSELFLKYYKFITSNLLAPKSYLSLANSLPEKGYSKRQLKYFLNTFVRIKRISYDPQTKYYSLPTKSREETFK